MRDTYLFNFFAWSYDILMGNDISDEYNIHDLCRICNIKNMKYRSLIYIEIGQSNV